MANLPFPGESLVNFQSREGTEVRNMNCFRWALLIKLFFLEIDTSDVGFFFVLLKKKSINDS